jgi:hypothetical protein
MTERELPEVGETVRLTSGFDDTWTGARIHVDGRAFSPSLDAEYAYGHDVDDHRDHRPTSVSRGEWEPIA